MSFRPREGTNQWPVLKTGLVPAVNAEAQIVVPDDEVWEVKSLEVELAADANAANRILTILVEDKNGIQLWTGPADGTAITANQTVKYHLAQYVTPPADSATDHFDTLPERQENFKIPPGSIITTSTAALQATDQYSTLKVFVDKFSLTR